MVVVVMVRYWWPSDGDIGNVNCFMVAVVIKSI